MALRDRKPFPHTSDEVAQTAAAVKDPSFRNPTCPGGYPRLQPRRPAACDRPFRALSRARGGRGREPCVLPRGRARPGPDRMAVSASATSRTTSWNGGWRSAARTTASTVAAPPETAALPENDRETVITTLGTDGVPYVAPMGGPVGGRSLPDRAVSSLHHPRQPPAQRPGGHQLHRRRARLRRLPHGAQGLAPRSRRERSPGSGSRRRWPTWRSRWRGGKTTSCARASTAGALARENHAAFRGFNRAQAAVVEAAILVSRLHMLPAEKIDREMDYLRIAVEKTAGPHEREAWRWLVERVADHRRDME